MSRCKKCGSFSISKKYDDGWPKNYDSNRFWGTGKELADFRPSESLIFTCLTCGYVWNEPTLDSKQKII